MEEGFLLLKWFVLSFFTFILIVFSKNKYLHINLPLSIFLLFIIWNFFAIFKANNINLSIFSFSYRLIMLIFSFFLFNVDLKYVFFYLAFFESIISFLQYLNIIPPFNINFPMNMFGTIGNCNFNAYFMLGSVLYFLIKKNKLRWFEVIIIIFIIIISLIIQSRGAIIAFFISLFGIFIKNKESNLLKLFFFILIFGFFVNLKYFLSIKNDIRILTYKIALDMFMDNPLLGIGPDNFRYKYLYYQGHFLKSNPEFIKLANNAKHVHNEYLQILVETGIIGFSIYVIFLIISVYFLLREKSTILFLFIFIHIAFLFSFPGITPVTSIFIFLPVLEIKAKRLLLNKNYLLIVLLMLLMLFGNEVYWAKKFTYAKRESNIKLLKRISKNSFLLNGKAYFWLGNIYFKNKEYLLSLKNFLLSREYYTDVAIFYNIGIVFNRLKRFKQAMHFFEIAFEMNPTRKKGYYKLKEIYKKLNKKDKLDVLERKYGLFFKEGI